MKTWTPAEVEILKENYNRVSNTELEKMLPHKSALGIYKKAYAMGLRKNPEIEKINRSNAKKLENSPNWKDGVSITSKGYRMILCPDHKKANKRGYVMEHVYVFEKETGVEIPANCCIHHLNGNKQDNRIENLCMMTHSAHTVYHNKERRKK